MPTVHTVLGPVETADLGFTLSHEHVGSNAAGLRHTYPEFLDRAGLLEEAVAAMREAYQEGVRTMVEVSTFDLGRDIGLIQDVSRRSGVQLIAATGNHLAVPRPFGEVSPDVIARLYSREIEEGIEGTGINGPAQRPLKKLLQKPESKFLPQGTAPQGVVHANQGQQRWPRWGTDDRAPNSPLPRAVRLEPEVRAAPRVFAAPTVPPAIGRIERPSRRMGAAPISGTLRQAR